MSGLGLEPWLLSDNPTHYLLDHGEIKKKMAALAGHAVAYTIGPILKHINDCVQLYFNNGFL